MQCYFFYAVYTVPRSAYVARKYDSSLILSNVTSCASNLSDQDMQTLNMQVKRLERKRCYILQWHPIQMRAFHSNENGLFCTHPLSVTPLFWWKERGKQEALI